MKEKFRLIIMVILFVILVIIGASLIRDFLIFVIGDKLGGVWFFIIHFILILIFVEIPFKTRSGKYIKEKLFKIK